MVQTLMESPAGRLFVKQVAEDGKTNIRFPGGFLCKCAVVIILIGLALALLGWFGPTRALVVGAAVAVVGVLLFFSHHEMTIGSKEVVWYVKVCGFALLTAPVPIREIAEIRAEEDGKNAFFRIYSKDGGQVHIEGFASNEERDWFLLQLEELVRQG
jgi:hypothetical protein